MQIRAMTLCSVLLVSGCAAITGPLSTRKSGEAPGLGSITERSVGDVMYEVFDYREVQGISVAEIVNLGHMGGRGTITPDISLVAFEHKNLTVYCTPEALYHMPLDMGRGVRVCLASRSHKEQLDSWEIMQPGAGWLNLEHPVSYTYTKTMATGNGFRWELLYEGVSGNTVSILYREFIGDLVRPGFQQDLKYTLADSGPTEIRFRVARLRIVSADNNGIKYEILSGLRPPR
jgi:hypothetical protein